MLKPVVIAGREPAAGEISLRTIAPRTLAPAPSWQAALPVLVGPGVTLRDLELADAPALAAMLATEQVTRFIAPPPTTVDGFERFIAWAAAQRSAGVYICFAMVPRGCTTAVGIIHIRDLGRDFGTAEWGFAMGEGFWGTGLFVEAAQLALAFAFDTVGVYRLEARAVVENGRGNGALRKLGARREVVLRGSFASPEGRLDQALWALQQPDWVALKYSAPAVVH